MRFSSFALALLPLALASPIANPDAAGLVARSDEGPAVLKGIASLKAEVVKLNDTLNTFPDDASSIPITTEATLEGEISKIESILKSITNDAKKSSKFTASQSTAITSALRGTKSTTFQTLDNLVAHKPAAENAGIGSDVQGGLEDVKSEVQAAFAAIEAKEVGPSAKQSATIEKAYIAHFNKAIAAYGSS